MNSAEKANMQRKRNVGIQGSSAMRLTQTTAEIDRAPRCPGSPGGGNPGLGVGHVSLSKSVRSSLNLCGLLMTWAVPPDGHIPHHLILKVQGL